MTYDQAAPASSSAPNTSSNPPPDHYQSINFDQMASDVAQNFPQTIALNRNPLMCSVCQDYYREPCQLQCYHTFCARCLASKSADGAVVCPVCGQKTALTDAGVPPPDLLMGQLVEIANRENPPCSNCDVRDRNNMHYCSTCNQSLCNHCRENTHRAKMFSTHEVLHMSKCTKEPKKCPIHLEQYIMFSNRTETMLCVNCFRDTAADQRSFCVDIDTAYAQARTQLDRASAGINELQTSIRDGLIMFKSLLTELRQNMDTEKHTINTFCQGMQEAIAKTHASMIMEVQRQFESKEKVFRGQLMTLGSVLPIMQQHLQMCQMFSNSANKFQFLELAFLMFERLKKISQLSHPLRPVQSSAIRTNYRNEFAQSLEPWIGKSLMKGYSANIYEKTVSSQQQQAKRKLAEELESPFANHCRSFESQIKELCQQITAVKERLGELHRDVTVLRRDNMPPLSLRYECIARDCTLLDENLAQHQQELDGMRDIFDALWEDQLYRIKHEQEIYHSQVSDITLLRTELKQLINLALQLEPYIKDKSIDSVVANPQNLQKLLEQIGLLQLENNQLKSVFKMHEAKTKGDGMKIDSIPVRESRSKQQQNVAAEVVSRVSNLLGDSVSNEQKRNIICQLLERVNRKKSPEDVTRAHQDGTGPGSSNVALHLIQQCGSLSSIVRERERSKSTSCMTKGQRHAPLTAKDSVASSKGSQKLSEQIATATIERLESSIKGKLNDVINRRQSKTFEEMQANAQRMTPRFRDVQIDTVALHRELENILQRKISKEEFEKILLLRQTQEALKAKKLGKSCDRLDQSFKTSQPNMMTQSLMQRRSKTPDVPRMRSKTPPEPYHTATIHKPRISDRYFVDKSRRSKTPPGTVTVPPMRNMSMERPHRSCRKLNELPGDFTGCESKPPRKCSKGALDGDDRSSSKETQKKPGKRVKVYPFSDGEDAAEHYRTQRYYNYDDSLKTSKESLLATFKQKDFEMIPCKNKKTSVSIDDTELPPVPPHYHHHHHHHHHGAGTSAGPSHYHQEQANHYHSIVHQRQNSFESLSTVSLNSRRSSLENVDKTVLLVLGGKNQQSTSTKSLSKLPLKDEGKSKKAKPERSVEFQLKQRTWETYPPKKYRNITKNYCYYHIDDDLINFEQTKQKLDKEYNEQQKIGQGKGIEGEERSERRQQDEGRRSIPGPSSLPYSSDTVRRTPKPVDKKPTDVGNHRQTIKKRFATHASPKFSASIPSATSPSSNNRYPVQAAGYATTVKPKRGGVQSRQQILADQRGGYYSEYEPDFDTEDVDDEEDDDEMTYSFDDQLNLTFRKHEPRKNAGSLIEQRGFMSTFKGGGDIAPMAGSSSLTAPRLSTFKGDSSQSLMTYDPKQDDGAGNLKKSDSFEGHEEAVRTLVAAVQETRSAATRKSK